jgi:Dolichyl-phosphate-mannose-protein mannosyltransferase
MNDSIHPALTRPRRYQGDCLSETKPHRLTGWIDWLAEGKAMGLPAALFVVAAYCLTQIIVLPLASHLAGTGVGNDDAEQIVYTQFLWLGYGNSQPPLFTWIVWVVAKVFGATIFTLKLTKYTLVFVGFAAVHRLVVLLGRSPRAAAAAVFGVALVPQIAWEMQRQLSHSVAAFCFIALFFLALVSLFEKRTVRRYCLLGLMIAAVVLSKYNGIIVVAAALLAALVDDRTRPVILARNMLIAIAVALIALAPVLVWNATHTSELLAGSYKLKIDTAGHPSATALRGMIALARAVFSSIGLPLLVWGAALAWARLRPWNGLASNDSAERLLWRMSAFSLAVTAALILATGTTQVNDRWLLPLLFAVPIAAAIGADHFAGRGARAQNLVIAVGAFVAVALLPATWFVQTNSGHGLGRAVQMNYTALRQALTETGEVRTAVSDWAWVGNLRLVDPGIRVIYSQLPDFASLVEMPSALLWLDTDQPAPATVAALAAAGIVPQSEPRYVQVPEFLGPVGNRRVGMVALGRRETVASGTQATAQ